MNIVCMDGWVDACMHAWVDGWLDGWMYVTENIG